jgi:HD-GYP domain-containing protein (c-di-GMP phosphodiesterase class II)
MPRAEKVLQMRIRDVDHAPPFARDFLDVTRGMLINVPIFIADRYLGSLVMTRDELEPYPEHEVATIQMIADQVGVALQSVRSFEEKEKILVGILLALTKSIDAKSKWTAGHSERVAHLSEELGLRCNLEEAGIRTLTFSAILHDIGKIAVPEIILDKPARLSPEEYEVVKQHPSVGAEIIYDIPSYENIVPGILYHHEHWDGGGYPLGLRGQEIPLNSRIITIADVFDAITADRPYRSGMSRIDAYGFMRDNRGILFDPDLVGEFIDLLVEEEAGKRD